MLAALRLSMNVLSLEFLRQSEFDRDPRLVPTRPDQRRSPRFRDSQMASLSHYPTDISFLSRHRGDSMSGRSFRSDRHVLPAQGPNTSCSPFAFPHPDANIRYLVRRLHTLHKRQSCGEDVCGQRSAPVQALLEQEESVIADMILEARAVDITPAVAQTTTQLRLLSDALSSSVHPTYTNRGRSHWNALAHFSASATSAMGGEGSHWPSLYPNTSVSAGHAGCDATPLASRLSAFYPQSANSATSGLHASSRSRLALTASDRVLFALTGTDAGTPELVPVLAQPAAMRFPIDLSPPVVGDRTTAYGFPDTATPEYHLDGFMRNAPDRKAQARWAPLEDDDFPLNAHDPATTHEHRRSEHSHNEVDSVDDNIYNAPFFRTTGSEEDSQSAYEGSDHGDFSLTLQLSRVPSPQTIFGRHGVFTGICSDSQYDTDATDDEDDALPGPNCPDQGGFRQGRDVISAGARLGVKLGLWLGTCNATRCFRRFRTSR